MDLTELGLEIDSIMDEEPAETFRWLIQLVRQENWHQIHDYLGEEMAEAIRGQRDSLGREEYLAFLERIAKEETDKLNREIKQSLTSVSSFQIRGYLGDKLSQFDRRGEHKKRKSNLLAVAFADRLTDLVFPAADRASRLADLIVRVKPSPEAEKYLQEACLCYFYELYSASAIMCRSVLEEVIEQRLRRLKINHLKLMQGKEYTLGVMLGLAERSELRNHRVVPPEALHAAQTVNRLGRIAVHERPLVDEEAWECLTAARHALTSIIG
jgi:hypothetical protein